MPRPQLSSLVVCPGAGFHLHISRYGGRGTVAQAFWYYKDYVTLGPTRKLSGSRIRVTGEGQSDLSAWFLWNELAVLPGPFPHIVDETQYRMAELAVSLKHQEQVTGN
jgi:hypothetical protein